LLSKTIKYGKRVAGTGAYLQRSSNIVVAGEKVTLNNKPIVPNKIYTVALSDYLMKGFDIPFLKNGNPEVIDVYKPKENETSFDIRKAVIEFLRTQ